jgi:hypothetical protein
MIKFTELLGDKPKSADKIYTYILRWKRLGSTCDDED